MSKIVIKMSRCAMKVSLLTGVALINISPALAQDRAAALTSAQPLNAQDAEAQSEQGEEVVVTGSLVAKSGFDMPTPMTVIGEADLEHIGAPDIAEVINQIPSLRASLTDDSTADQSSASGGTFADLRGLGDVRTLVLVDGRRYSPANSRGTVSTGTLPQAMLKGVDIVTGGASAAYGSDAVAGVVNYKVNDRLKGLKGTIQGGISDYGDYRHYLASVAYGTSLFDDRARLIVAGEVAGNTGVKYNMDRPWNVGVSQIANPAYTSTNDEPQELLVAGATYSNHTLGGLINSPTRLANLHFLPDGSAVPFNRGTLVTSTSMVGGDGAPIRSLNTASIPNSRTALFARFVVEPSDSITLFVEGNYSRLKSEFLSVTGNEQITLRRENPFLPQSVRDVMVANNIASLRIRRSYEDNARVMTELDIETRRLVAGVEGKFGGSWHWDAYYSGGWTDRLSTSENSRITDNFDLAIDAVINPANGATVCRSTLTNPTNGCVPLNLVGYGRASPEALAYVNGTGSGNQYVAQHVIAAKMRGEPFSTWAGPVGIAFGAEKRWVTVDSTADPISAAYGFRSGNSDPYIGQVTVKEAFGELLIPLARDAKWAKHFSLNLAGRATDYSTSGQVYTWKIGANYSPIDSLRFRATRSRDIRAPSVGEFYALGTTAQSTISDPARNEIYPIQVRNTGNPFLRPEVADTITAGVVYSPSFARGLRLSVDYWDIKVNDAITSLSVQTLIYQCTREQKDAACAVISRPAPGEQIAYVINGPINFESMEARGVDFEASYRTSLGKGRLDLRALATYYHRGYMISDETGIKELHDSVDQAAPRTLGGNPHWKINTRLTYSQGGSFISLAGRYVGGGRLQPGDDYKDLNVLRVSGRLLLDVSAQYPILKKRGDSVVLFGSIRNLLNTDPPITGEASGTTRSLYDTIGRVYRAGVKFRF